MNPDKKKALLKAQNLCVRSEKCVYDVKIKLAEWKTNPDDIADIIQSLIDEKFIDENRYTEFFVRDKIKLNKWGKTKVRFQLQQKKIDSKIINEALETIDSKEYYNIIQSELKKKSKVIKAKDSYDFKNKLLQFGASRGYEPDYMYKILKDIND